MNAIDAKQREQLRQSEAGAAEMRQALESRGAVTKEERQNPAVWIPIVDASRAALRSSAGRALLEELAEARELLAEGVDVLAEMVTGDGNAYLGREYRASICKWLRQHKEGEK